jgi:hypothetical protein
VGPGAGSRTTEPSRHAFDLLRRELLPTLDRLDRAAADPWSLDAASDLRTLQYTLHVAAERLHRLESRVPGADGELESALAAARDETADVAETLDECGPFAASSLVWEWRVSLFAVRLALRGLETDEPASAALPPPERAVLPLALLGAGVAVVLGGALASLWPVWLLGLALVAASTALSQRLP